MSEYCKNCEKYKQALAPLEDEYFKGLNTKQIAGLAKKSIKLTTENRKLEAILDEIEGRLDKMYIHFELYNPSTDTNAYTPYEIMHSCKENIQFVLDIISEAKGEVCQ